MNPVIFPFLFFFTIFHNSHLPWKCLSFMIFVLASVTNLFINKIVNLRHFYVKVRIVKSCKKQSKWTLWRLQKDFSPLCNYLCIRYRASLLKYHLPHICHLSNPSDRRDTGRTPLKGHTWFLITLDVTIHQNRALDLGHSVLNLKLL